MMWDGKYGENLHSRVSYSLLGRNLSWRMGDHSSNLFVTVRITQLLDQLPMARAFIVTWEFPPLGRKVLDRWKNAIEGEFRRCGCGKQLWPQRKVIGWLPEFYCSEVMVDFSTLCFPSRLHAPIKNQAIGCLLPEVLYEISRKLQTAFSRVIFMWSSIILKKVHDFFTYHFCYCNTKKKA